MPIFIAFVFAFGIVSALGAPDGPKVPPKPPVKK